MTGTTDNAMTVRGSGQASLATLAARAQLGDRGALEKLLLALQPQLGDHVRAILRDHDHAADVLQDVLLIICRRLGTVRETRWIRAWAYRIATREAYRSMRRTRRRLEQSITDLPDITNPRIDEHEVGDAELLSELPAKLATVPAAAQIVLRMHYMSSLTQAEIAESLEIPLGTVKSRLAYGLACLRRTWTSAE